jgi:hypothetical protein
MTFKHLSHMLFVTALVSGCSSSPRTVYSEPAPENGVPLLAGEFTDVDTAHWANGTATIIRGADGAQVLRLGEGFSSARGPDLFVMLSDRERPRDGHRLGDSVTLGELKSTVGGQNYTIPDDVDIAQFKSVVIYCLSFEVIFSTATLANVLPR